MNEYEIQRVRAGGKYFTMFLEEHPEEKLTCRWYEIAGLVEADPELSNYVLNHGYAGMIVTWPAGSRGPTAIRSPGRPPNYTEKDEAEHMISVIE